MMEYKHPTITVSDKVRNEWLEERVNDLHKKLKQEKKDNQNLKDKNKRDRNRIKSLIKVVRELKSEVEKINSRFDIIDYE